MARFKKFEKSIAIYHGYGDWPQLDRIEYLQSIGYTNIHYPYINFDKEWYKDECKSLFSREVRAIEDIGLVMGFSLGGYLAFELAGKSRKDLILVNPGIDRSKTKLDIKYFDIPENRNFGKIETYLGSEDDLIDKNITINFLRESGIKSNTYIFNGMEHWTYIDEFITIMNNSKLIKKE